MSKIEFDIDLGKIDFSKLETDEDFHREARRLVPTALTKFGEKMAEHAWNETQKAFKSVKGFKPNSSTIDKSKFIRETAAKYKRDASAKDRKEVEEHIVAQMRKQKKARELRKQQRSGESQEDA
jgi:hypothetical protein